MKRKAISIFFVFLWVFIVIGGRLAHIGLGQTYQFTAGSQSRYTLTVDIPRGTIFDRNGQPITNSQGVYKTAVTPTPQVISAIHKQLTGQEKEQVLALLADRKPFLLQTQRPLQAKGAATFACFAPQPIHQPAIHLTGYVNADSVAVCGLQKTYDFLLNGNRTTTVTYVCDATGGALPGIEPNINDAQSITKQGVITTLDLAVQTAAEQAFPQGKKGAVVVQKAGCGDLLACYSAPDFSPRQVESALSDPDLPMLNRPLTAYNVGSLFKLCVAAAALEQGISIDAPYTCTGSITCSHTFACHKAEGHGTLTMKEALAASCNTYFIDLASKVGGQPIYDMAVAMGLGKSTLLCQDLTGESGQLPSLEELLRSPAELANFAIGQGVFMATPLQLSAVVNTIASRGIYYDPRLILATVTPGGTHQSGRIATGRQIVSEQTATLLNTMMQAVMTDGTGTEGALSNLAAAGKTATAQTGMVDSAGSPVTQAWFVGFFPAHNPQYTVTVLVENGRSGGADAAPIFKEICQQLTIKKPTS